MKRLFFLILLGAAAWYGWKKYPELAERRPGHLAVIQNASTAELVRVRVKVDGQTLVKETIASGGEGSLPFKVTNDSPFEVVWEYQGRAGEKHWNGGQVFKGPMQQRHIFRIDDDNEVIYRTENR